MRGFWKRAILLAYPRDLRRDHGDEIVLAVDEEFQRHRGLLGRVRWLRQTLSDAASSWRGTRPPARVPRRESPDPLRNLGSDIRAALRLFLQAPWFAAGAVVTLALGIGATTAIFSLADATLLRPLPFPDAERVLVTKFSWSMLDFRDYASRQGSFTDVAAWAGVSIGVESGGETHSVDAITASGTYARMLGLPAIAGRVLDERDDQPGAPSTAMISERLWKRVYGARSDIIGQTVAMNRQPVTIVGVVPAWFRGTSLGEKVEVVIPLATMRNVATGFLNRADIFTKRGNTWLKVAGRLRPDRRGAPAEEEMNAIYRDYHPKHDPANPRDRHVLVPLPAYAIGLDTSVDLRTFILILSGAALVTLLLACTTVANLLLVRADRRERELAIRTALGAGRMRMARLILVESAALGIAGALSGLAVAHASLTMLETFTLPGNIGVNTLGLSINTTVLAIAIALGIATSLVFGLAPLARAVRMDVTSALRGSQGHSPRQPLRTTLVVVQVALCVILLGGGFAFGRAVRHAFAIDLGFDTTTTAIVSARSSVVRYGREQVLDVQARTSSALKDAPWLRAAGWGLLRPLSGRMTLSLTVPDFTPERPETVEADANAVSPGYLEAMAIPLRAGRLLTPQDAKGALRVAVVSEALVRRFWPNRDPLGARFANGTHDLTPDSWWTVVGVVGDIRRGLERPIDPMIYLPIAQFESSFDFGDQYLFVAANGVSAATAAAQAAATIRRIDPLLPISSRQTMHDHVGAAAMVHRLGFTLFALFAGLAVVLTAIGVYAVVAFAIARRTREIGIRVALGAPASSVLGLVLRQGARPVGIGLVAGIAGYWWTSGALSRFLLSLPAFDASLAAAIAAMVSVIAAIALVVPLRRALSIDPVRTLRSD